MKKIIIIVVAVVAVVAALAAGFGYAHVNAEQQEELFFGGRGPMGGAGMPMGNRAAGGFFSQNRNDISAIAKSDLSADEQASIVYMVQEEQLARDVYNTFYTQYGLAPFQRIAQSEQMHIDAVKQLITRYGITDPSLEAGKYADPALQKLYTDLTAQGSKSLTDALQVSALIEETDISDLRERMNNADNADIQLIFNNLMNASFNHLRAYANNYAQQSGSQYSPSILSAEELQTLLASPMGNGMHNGQGMGMGRGQGQFQGQGGRQGRR